MFTRYVLLVFGVLTMACGAICATVGPGVLPYQVRGNTVIEWVTDYPSYAFFGGAALFVLALLFRPGRSVCVGDFRG